MDNTEQAPQVFVDDSGRRSRLVAALGRVAAVAVLCYLVLLVAGFLGASWVPSVRLPIVGDIFDAGGEPSLPAEAAGVAPSPSQADLSHSRSSHGRHAVPVATAIVRAVRASQKQNGSASNNQKGAAPTPANNGRGNNGQPTTAPSPNRGTNGNSDNAGPKPKASPNHGSNGNSDNAGPKPKPTTKPGNGNGKDPAPAASPSP
jgi:hypothetical protein